MLLIGAAGRNVGKTHLACALIGAFRHRGPLVGVKVTAVRERFGGCPRGGDGCGVCSDLEGPFPITDETIGPVGKDTTALAEAGARPVWWMRVLHEHLEEGARALIEHVGPDAVCICESNSLRRVVEPGLFLMVRDARTDSFKATAAAVKHLADRIVASDGLGHDLDLQDVELVDGRWSLREPATAIVLAGGRSSRMGRDKSLLPVDGSPLIAAVCAQLRSRFQQVVVSANDPEKYAFLGCRVVPDAVAGQGPLMAIASALDQSETDLNVVVACDIPVIDPAFMAGMLARSRRRDGVVPVHADGGVEPLLAVYRKSALPGLRQALADGERRVLAGLERCRIRYVPLDGADWLRNLNTPAQYEDFRRDVTRAG